MVEKLILFRPVICKHKGDKTRFPEQQFFKIDGALAVVMRDALRHLRLHYAVDHDRFVMTGLSQAGYYSYYYALSFPDEFAGIVPESAGGMGVRAAIRPLARNLAGMRVKILHAEGDKVTPFADAESMRGAITDAGGKVEFVKFTASDYRRPNPSQHPTPHSSRIENVLPFVLECQRSLSDKIDRVVRYPQQGGEGRFRVDAPQAIQGVFELQAANDKGSLSSNRDGTVYLVAPGDLLAKRKFKVGRKRVTPKADIGLLLRSFRECPDPGRLVAAEIKVR